MARESQGSSYCVDEAMSSEIFPRKDETRKEVRDIQTIVADCTQQFRDHMIMFRQQLIEMIREEVSIIKSQSGPYIKNSTESRGSSPPEVVPVGFTATDEAISHGKAPDLIPDCLMVGTVIRNEGGDQSQEKNEEKGDSIDYCESDASPNRSGVRSNLIQPVDYQQSPTLSSTTESNTSIPRFNPNHSPTIVYPSTIERNKNREETIQRWSCFPDRHNWIWVPGEERNKDDKAHINEFFIVQAQTDILNWPKTKPESDTLSCPNSTPSLSTSDGRDGWSDDQRKLPPPPLPPPLPTWTPSPPLPPPPPWPALLPPPPPGLPRSPVLGVLTRWSPHCDGKSCNRCLEKAGRYPIFDTCLHVKETEKKSQIGEEEEDDRVDEFLKDRWKGSGDNKSIMNSSIKSPKSKELDSSLDPCPAYMNRPNPKVCLPGELSSKPSLISSGVGIGKIPWIYDASVTRKEVSDHDHAWPNRFMGHETFQGGHNPISSKYILNLGSITHVHDSDDAGMLLNRSAHLHPKRVLYSNSKPDLKWPNQLIPPFVTSTLLFPCPRFNSIDIEQLFSTGSLLCLSSYQLTQSCKNILNWSSMEIVDELVWQKNQYAGSRVQAWELFSLSSRKFEYGPLKPANTLHVLSFAKVLTWLIKRNMRIVLLWKCLVAMCPPSSVDAITSRLLAVNHVLIGEPTVISKEILKVRESVVLAGSFERSVLHQYFKLFHEVYKEYMSKVYVELTRHGIPINKIIEEQCARLCETHMKLAKAHLRKIPKEVVRLMVLVRSILVKVLWSAKMKIGGLIIGSREVWARLLGKGKSMRDEEDTNLSWGSPDHSNEESAWFYLFQFEGLGLWAENNHIEVKTIIIAARYSMMGDGRIGPLVKVK